MEQRGFQEDTISCQGREKGKSGHEYCPMWLSQTQFITAKIAKIVQEIRDIREPTTRCKNNPSREDIYGKDGEHRNNSSYNIPQCQSKLDNLEHRVPYPPDTPSPQNETPAQKCPGSDPSLQVETKGHIRIGGLRPLDTRS